MTLLTIDDIHSVLLEILTDVDAFCRRNGIRRKSECADGSAESNT